MRSSGHEKRPRNSFKSKNPPLDDSVWSNRSTARFATHLLLALMPPPDYSFGSFFQPATQSNCFSVCCPSCSVPCSTTHSDLCPAWLCSSIDYSLGSSINYLLFAPFFAPFFAMLFSICHTLCHYTLLPLALFPALLLCLLYYWLGLLLGLPPTRYWL